MNTNRISRFQCQRKGYRGHIMMPAFLNIPEDSHLHTRRHENSLGVSFLSLRMEKVDNQLKPLSFSD
jgi:hypothetical protein